MRYVLNGFLFTVENSSFCAILQNVFSIYPFCNIKLLNFYKFVNLIDIKV